MTDHRNVVREDFFRDFGDVTLVQNLFKQIRAINRTNSRPIWTPTCEDIDHIAKSPWKPPPKKKNPHMLNIQNWIGLKEVILNYLGLDNKCWLKAILWKYLSLRVHFESIWPQNNICHSKKYFGKEHFTKTHLVLMGKYVLRMSLSLDAQRLANR